MSGLRRPSPAGAGTPAAPVCHPHTGCITCSDEGIPMTVLHLEDAGLAVCREEGGAHREVLIGLVPDAAPGDRLLVHAGTALARLEAP